MANFDKAITVVLKNEGGYVYDHMDAGGETNYGICARDNPKLDIKNLTEASASKYYLTKWWTPNNFSLITDDGLATWLFDHAVNCGTETVIKILQGIVQESMQAANVWDGIHIDGVLGPQTAALVNKYYSKDTMLKIQEKLWNHYLRIMDANPQDQKFYHGWHTRCFQNV
jgi:lysozyme family protein